MARLRNLTGNLMGKFKSTKKQGLFWFVIAFLGCLISSAQAAGTCTLAIASQVINADNQMLVQFQPSSSSTYAEFTILLSIPSYMGMSIDDDSFRCTGYLGGSAFNSGTPLCEKKADGSAGELQIEISNLVSTDISTYALTIYGFLNGPSAVSNGVDSSIGQTSDIECISKSSTGTVFETAIVSDNAITFTAIQATSGFTFTTSPTYNYVNSVITLVIYMTQQIPVSGSVSVGFPYLNQDYTSLGASGNDLYVANTGSAYAEVSYNTGSSYTVTVSSVAARTVGSLQYIDVMMGNSALIPSNAVLTVKIGTIKNPPNLKSQSGFAIQTGDQYLNQIEYATYSTLRSLLPTIDSYASQASSAEIDGNTGVLEEDIMYKFTIVTIGDIPKDGYFTLYIPSEIGVPTSPASQLVFTCQTNCQSSGATITWSSSSRILTFKDTYPANSNYLTGGGTIVFTLNGFTNPAGTDKAYFVWRSYALVSSANYQIDELSNMYIEAQQGYCSEIQFYPTDNNKYMYGQPVSWTLIMQCSHQITENYGVQITFFDDEGGFVVKQTAKCTVESTSQYYTCSASYASKSITIMKFSELPIQAQDQFSLTFDSVISPGWEDYLSAVTFSTISDDGNVIDTGTFEFERNYFYRGYIQKFTVTPQDYGVGQYPVYYDFEVQPTGEIWEDSYFIITLPSQISFYQERAIEKFCSYNVTEFEDNTYFNCKVTGQYLKITDAFQDGNSSHMTQEHDFLPATFKFTLPQFVNPRTTGASNPFDIAFYDKTGKTLYDWDTSNSTYALYLNGESVTNITSGPCVQMSKAATPQLVSLKRGSEANGVINAYNFTVRTTNTLLNGDQILVKMPRAIGLSNETYCVGSSGNLYNKQECSVSDDETEILMTLKIASYRRMLEGRPYHHLQEGRSLQGRKIKSNTEFVISIQNVKNPISTEPTGTSIEYSVYSGGKLIETKTSGMQITNTRPGAINPAQMSIIPEDFRKSRISNYTLEFWPTNYAQNMRMLVALPKEIEFASNAITCHGLSGTDSPEVICLTHLAKKWILIQDAFAYQVANPGKIRIQFEAFQNPSENIVTSSFKLATQTSTKYLLDVAADTLEINFFCEYPCASCDSRNKTKCLSCYGGADDYNMFFEYQCLRQCPFGLTNTTTNNCTECYSPCETCSIQPSYCTSCTIGYTVVLDSGYCREVVYWPFPFLIISFISFFVILASEIITKSESRFKEILIASLSVAETMAWVTLTGFFYIKKGEKGPTALAGGAVLMSITLNLAHACMHPRKIVPNSLPSYKQLFSKYKCSTYMVMTVSCLISFKYSLILVSYFWMHPKYSGDYSALNWMQFNKFSFAFMVIPCPLMLLACVQLLSTDGMFSYAGFVAIEVIILSSALSTLMFSDAISVIKCRVSNPGVRKPQKVATGLHDELDQDEFNTRRILKKKTKLNGMDDSDEDDTFDKIQNHAALKPSGRMDEETRRQILLLEELAKQMREEKEQLRLEKERIERERALFDEEEAKNSMNDYLYENNKLAEGLDANNEEIKSLIHDKSNLTRRPYKDIEGEMEDYERIHEEEHETESNGEEMQVEHMPEPAFGQINYFRQKDGEEQVFLQQLSPRAGGDSLIGAHDMEGDPEFHLLDKTRPIFDEDVSLNNSMVTNENYAIRDDASAGLTNLDRSQAAITEVFHEKSDAQMEHVSDHQSLSAELQFIENKDDALQGTVSANSLTHNIEHIEKVPTAIGEDVSNPPTAIGQQENYLAPEDAAKGDVTAGANTHRSGKTEKYLENEPGHYSALNSDREKEGETEHYFNQEPHVEDSQGHSESSEGIVDHGAFNRVTDVKQGDNKQNDNSSKALPAFLQGKLEEKLGVNKAATGKVEPDLRASLTKPGRPVQESQEAITAAQAQGESPRPTPQNNRKKQIIYSDKSESSVEDMMHDTPSNYNLANGRLDGKSMGLKAILQQAQKHAGVSLNLNLKSVGLGLKPGEIVNKLGEGEGLNKSQDGGWAASNPIAGHKVPVIAENDDEQDYTTGGGVAPSGVAGKRKAIKTNKTFAEPPLPGSSYKYNSITPTNNMPNPQQQVRKNNFVE